MPRWLAPNVITLLGILAIYANIVTILIYVPDLSSSGPSWIYFSFAFSLFLPNHGQHWRQAGPGNGLLFSTGWAFWPRYRFSQLLPGWTCSIGMHGNGLLKDSAFITFITCVAMYLSTWETYHTHVLYLGYLNGPTEGIIIIVITMLISAIKGVEYWNSPINEVFPAVIQFFISYIVPPSDTKQFADRPIKDLWIYIAFGLCYVSMFQCVFSTFININKLRKCLQLALLLAKVSETIYPKRWTTIIINFWVI